MYSLPYQQLKDIKIIQRAQSMSEIEKSSAILKTLKVVFTWTKK